MPSRRFPIRGGFYALADRHWSSQDLLNMIAVPSESGSTKTELALNQLPGLRPFADIGTGKIRGLWNVEGKLFVVSGTQLYEITTAGVAIPRGNVPGVGRVSMAHNQYGGGHQLVVDNGSARYVYNTVDLTLEKVTDASFPGSFCAFYIDQYLGFVEPQGRYWGHSDLADALDYNSLDTYEAEADPDRIVWAHVSHREVLIFGRDTIEPFVNAPTGDGTAPFERAGGVVIEHGLSAKFSVVGMDSATFFLDDKRQVRELRGLQAVRISNAGIERALAECPQDAIARAYAFTWQDGPHKVYYLTVPGHFTFGFDLLTREWHRRGSPGMEAWRLNTLVFWGGQWIGGDSATGKLYTLDWDYNHDGTEELVREWTSGVLFADQKRVEVNEIEPLVTPGGPTTTVDAFAAQPEGPTLILGAPDGSYGVAYTHTYTATGGTPPYRFSLIPGETLPDGWALASDGELTCASPVLGVIEPPVRVTDANSLWDEGVDELEIGPTYIALLHFDGDTVDEMGASWSGGVPEATVKKFGTGSARINTDDNNIVTAHDYVQDIGTDDFTIDVWIYRDSVAGTENDIILGHWFAAGTRSLSWAIPRADDVLVLGLSADGTAQTTITGTIEVPYDEWVNLRIVREDGVVYQFVGGVPDGSAAFASALNTNEVLGLNWIIGGNDSTNTIDPAQGLYGYVDEFAIIGQSLGTVAYTPRTAPWPNP